MCLKPGEKFRKFRFFQRLDGVPFFQLGKQVPPEFTVYLEGMFGSHYVKYNT